MSLTPIIQYDWAQQKRKQSNRNGKKKPWISTFPRIGYGWTCWIKEPYKGPPAHMWGEATPQFIFTQHHTKKVTYFDKESGVVVTEDAIYIRG